MFFFSYGKVTNGLPLAAWYPFETSKSPYYEMVYVHQTISLILNATLTVFTDFVMAGLTTFVGVQCDFICNELMEMDQDSSKYGSINDIVNHHRNILK